MTHRLSDRPGLARECAQAEGTYEVLLTELKAAAIDVAARAAVDAGASVVFSDNVPLPVDGDDLDAAFDRIEALAFARAETRAEGIPALGGGSVEPSEST
jgi:cyclic 2,3-diphosphoglycerate synthetase